MHDDLADQGDECLTISANPQLQAVLTADDIISLAHATSFGLQPQPIQHKHEQPRPVLVVLVGDPLEIEPLLIDWLAEATVVCGLKVNQVDREILARPASPLGIPLFAVSSAIDHRNHIAVWPTHDLVQMIPDKAQLKVLRKEVLTHLVANLTGAVQKAWDHFEHEVRPKPSRHQFRQAVYDLLQTRVSLFGGSTPVAQGIIVLAWGEQRVVTTGYMSETSRRLQACLMTTPGTTSAAVKWLARQDSHRLGMRKKLEEIIEPKEEITEPNKPAKKTKRKPPTNLLDVGEEHIARIEKQFRRKLKYTDTKLGRKVRQLKQIKEIVETLTVPNLTEVVNPPAPKPKVTKLCQCIRKLRADRRIYRRKVMFLISLAKRRRRKNKREVRNQERPSRGGRH